MKIVIESEKDWFGSRATGVMLDEKNRVLLCQLERDDLWVLPGGGIRLHETLQETVERELFEEANFEITVQRLLWVIENFFIFHAKKHHILEFYFLVTPREPTGIWEQHEFEGQEDFLDADNFWHLPEGRTTLHFKWFDLTKLNEINFKPTILIELLKDLPTHPTHVVWDTYGRTIETKTPLHPTQRKP
ncbi:MAG: NUDIX hydrolase [Promethearchaeota archaeon]